MADFEVVSGNPTAEELAVVIAVVKAAASTQQHTEKTGRLRKTSSTWHRNAAMLRSPITPGPGQWGASVRAGLN